MIKLTLMTYGGKKTEQKLLNEIRWKRTLFAVEMRKVWWWERMRKDRMWMLAWEKWENFVFNIQEEKENKLYKTPFEREAFLLCIRRHISRQVDDKLRSACGEWEFRNACKCTKYEFILEPELGT